MAAFKQSGNTIRLEEFINTYPNSPRAAEALGAMLAYASEKDDKTPLPNMQPVSLSAIPTAKPPRKHI